MLKFRFSVLFIICGFRFYSKTRHVPDHEKGPHPKRVLVWISSFLGYKSKQQMSGLSEVCGLEYTLDNINCHIRVYAFSSKML